MLPSPFPGSTSRGTCRSSSWRPRVTTGSGAAFAVLRPVTGSTLFRTGPAHDAMPVAEAALTTREVRIQAAGLLPGARVRRLLFWRYLLTWRKPS